MCVCVYPWVCMCVYGHPCVYAYACILECVCMCTLVYMYVCTLVCVYVHVCTHVCICVIVYTGICMCVCVYVILMCANVYVHLCICVVCTLMCMCICMYMYTSMYVCMHVHSCSYVCTSMRVCEVSMCEWWCVCGGHRKTWKSLLSLSTIRVLGVEISMSGSHSKHSLPSEPSCWPSLLMTMQLHRQQMFYAAAKPLWCLERETAHIFLSVKYSVYISTRAWQTHQEQQKCHKLPTQWCPAVAPCP